MPTSPLQPHVHTSPGSVLRSFTIALSAVAAVDLDAAAVVAAGGCALLVRLSMLRLSSCSINTHTRGRAATLRSATRPVSSRSRSILPAASFLILARTATALPFDAHCLVPLPAPYGGCLVLSPHLLFPHQQPTAHRLHAVHQPVRRH